jgi:HAE1 family hydrophobic/amphiphilic exporter-1
MNLSSFSVRRPVAVLMGTLCILVLGFLSLQRLPLKQMPEVSFAMLSVNVDYPSSSPEEVEQNITRPLEEVLSTLDNLEGISSTSSGSRSMLRLEFKQGTDMDLMSLDIRDRIDQVRNTLPTDVDRVAIRRWHPDDQPVLRFSVAWSGAGEELYQVVEEILRRRLERIDGVANVEVRGMDTKQIIIDLDQGLLQAYGIDIYNLNQALNSNNLNVAGGYILDGGKKYSLRTVGEFTDIDEIANLPLRGGLFTLADVAQVHYDYPEKTSFSRLNGINAVNIDVYKASTANVVNVAGMLRTELEKIQALPQLQGQLSTRIFRDQSEAIVKSLDDLKAAGVYGGILAMGVLFFFLRKFRSTIIISISIPVSIVFTFAFMYLLRVFAGSDISLNVVSLMGLMVAIGMLVDSSVVVLENIFRYKQEKGLEAREAAIQGSQEVGLAVLASTATTLVVFASFIFAPGSQMGRFMMDFGLTVGVALTAALIVALTLIPMLSSRIFTGKEKPKQRVIIWLTEIYGALMGWLLRWRFVALIVMALLGFASYHLLTSIDREMLPRESQRNLRVNVTMERSLSAEDMVTLFTDVEKLILDRKADLGVASVSSNFSNRATNRGQYRGSMTIFLEDEGDIKPTEVVQEQVRGLFPEVPGVAFSFGRMRHMGGGEMGVNVELKGDESTVLAMYAEEVKAILSAMPELKDVESSLETGDEEIHLIVDRHRTEQFSISSQLVARTVASALSTRSVTRYKSDDGEIDIVVQLEEEDGLSLQELQNVHFENRNGEMIPLYAVADYQYEKGPLSIRRDDRKGTLRVMANAARGGGMFLTEVIQGELESQLHLPAGYSFDFGRDFMRFRRGEQDSFFAIILAIVLMYIIMAALFESFIHPLTILFCVPFSIIGVAGIFYLTGTTLNSMAYLGILVLFGIVVNNGIILIAHINILRGQGLARSEAIRRGGMDRLRPILMTAITSLFGLLPLCMPALLPEYFPATQGRAGMWTPVSLAVLGGLTTSTFLTLIILPTVYSYMDDVSRGCLYLIRFVSALLSRRASHA